MAETISKLKENFQKEMFGQKEMYEETIKENELELEKTKAKFQAELDIKNESLAKLENSRNQNSNYFHKELLIQKGKYEAKVREAHDHLKMKTVLLEKSVSNYQAEFEAKNENTKLIKQMENEIQQLKEIIKENESKLTEKTSIIQG